MKHCKRYQQKQGLKVVLHCEASLAIQNENQNDGRNEQKKKP